MEMERKFTIGRCKFKRRDFLYVFDAGAVAAPDARKAQRAGYRETESVKTYYKLARF